MAPDDEVEKELVICVAQTTVPPSGVRRSDEQLPVALNTSLLAAARSPLGCVAPMRCSSSAPTPIFFPASIATTGPAVVTAVEPSVTTTVENATLRLSAVHETPVCSRFPLSWLVHVLAIQVRRGAPV